MLHVQGTSTTIASSGQRPSSNPANRARRKFYRFFPDGFTDETYLDWERGYKWNAHQQWLRDLSREEFRKLIKQENFADIASRAIRIESRTNLLFSFEKMALRDAVRTPTGARAFATGLYDLLHGAGDLQHRFERWIKILSSLPRKQTRVLTWPLATVFAFIAQPDTHFFLKPRVTQAAARAYGLDFHYQSRPSAEAYAHVLEFANRVRRDLKDMKPRDLIDIQSFLWVQGSDEYEE